MNKLKFKVIPTDKIRKEKGVITQFIDGKGHLSESWWTSPPESIDHAGIDYLKNRHLNIKTEKHVSFIQAEFKKQMALLNEYENNKYTTDKEIELKHEAILVFSNGSIDPAALRINLNHPDLIDVSIGGCFQQTLPLKNGDWATTTNGKNIKNQEFKTDGYIGFMDVIENKANIIFKDQKWPNHSKTYENDLYDYIKFIQKYEPKIKITIVDCTFKQPV